MGRDNKDDDVVEEGEASRQPKRRRLDEGYSEARNERMARLRQEMKEEDDELAALDEQRRKEAEEASQVKVGPQDAIVEVQPEELEGLDEEEQMRKLLGFDGFGSTKGESVEDNQTTAAKGMAKKNKARKYRQYMNRKNGFNRPLEKVD